MDPYYWRAWLVCDKTTGPYSRVWTFTTGSGGTILPAPKWITPAADGITVPAPARRAGIIVVTPVAAGSLCDDAITVPVGSVHLQWSAVDGATKYLLQFGEASEAGHPVVWIDGTQYTIYAGSSNTCYVVSVAARNDYAIGDTTTLYFITATKP
jgi:hypothetical protein